MMPAFGGGVAPRICGHSGFDDAAWRHGRASLVKAVGRGLALPLDAFAVQVEPLRVRSALAELQAVGRWRLEQWRPSERS
jgi:hypothetical protein